jgi:recombinational DNA repair protein RecR
MFYCTLCDNITPHTDCDVCQDEVCDYCHTDRAENDCDHSL